MHVEDIAVNFVALRYASVFMYMAMELCALRYASAHVHVNEALLH